jgi:hypothetical protein
LLSTFIKVVYFSLTTFNNRFLMPEKRLCKNKKQYEPAFYRPASPVVSLPCTATFQGTFNKTLQITS